ncbi:UDP-glucose 4-epimerase [Desulfosalsimonas propionicica]|uniref:UDP-glucose 4-epimerase n=1 Tax=Desulfosalsimonas propionicica TaxID=332175 RepID=A0A7W0C5S1_9BACT|nr:UDP-glucose 4-epimerase GalE [Desulfosalsimonas propionicica]MBA2879720.1 UDP-glucose 4-epimerase [Desulfosalsimonas propionicica]
MKILLTGGAGYIGTHTCVSLIAAGHRPVVADNLVNARAESVLRVEKIAGTCVPFYQTDLRNKTELRQIFDNEQIECVIHFAGLKSVAESVQKPLSYYDNNLGATLALCEVMADLGVRDLVFSSSATVYGSPEQVPIKEDAPVAPFNPYGRTKLMIEQILKDLSAADPRWNVALLRYFNPVGAHVSGLIGEDPADIPNNLMPYISAVAVGRLAEVQVFGNDYPTADGTGVRDYIHVMDLAEGHVRALEKLWQNCGCVTYNLGTGRGYSVLEMIVAFENACNKKIPYRITGRRPGDIAECYADPGLAQKELNWQAQHGIDRMCVDTWRWQSMNPKGYRE